MRSLLFQSRLSTLKRLKWQYQTFSIALLLLCFGLVALCFQLKRSEKIILTPITGESSWVSESAVSNEYAASFIQYLSALRFNLTASNADFNREQLLKFTDPIFYEALKMTLLDEKKRLTTGNLATVFYPADVTVNAKEGKVNLKGQLLTVVGNKALPPVEVNYTVSYRYRFGTFSILNWTEETLHA